MHVNQQLVLRRQDLPRRLLTFIALGSCCRYDVSKKHPQGKTLLPALNQVFDPELSSWLLAELAENRDKSIGPNKVSSRVYHKFKLLQILSAWFQDRFESQARPGMSS